MNATVSGRVIEKQLVKAGAAIKDPAVGKTFLELIGPAIARSLPSRRVTKGRVPPPEHWMVVIGSRRWLRDDPSVALTLAARLHGKTFALKFARLLRKLHRLHRTIAEATDLTELMVWLRRQGGRIVTRTQYEDLIGKVAGRAAEDSVIFDSRFLGKVDDSIVEMLDLGADRTRMARLGLSQIDPEPLIYTKIRAPGASGSPEARLPYVDIAVMFRAMTPDGRIRYVTKIKCQVKLASAEGLVSGIDLDGEYRIGQLLNDRVRGPRGAWRFSEIRIPRDAIVDDKRITKVLTFASRGFTEEELESLAADRINVEHFEHGIAYDAFYRWARDVVDSAGIKVGK
jgi:hypothetical protein